MLKLEHELQNNSLPLYLQLKNIISGQIKDGVLKPGEKLPSERELCERYGVSRITVRQALNELSNEGLIDRSHGKGTFVSRTKVEQDLYSITPFQHFILSKGMKPRTMYIEGKVIPNSYHLSKILNVPLSENLVEMALLGLGDDMPMSFYTSFFSYELGIKMQELAQRAASENRSFTTFDLYKEIPQITLGVINQTFEASIADAYISNILKIKKGNPILIAESIIYSHDDRPLEYKTTIYRGDKYKFSLIRKPGSE
ncbi:MAG: GntR family transcriptional regulator [Peptococcaceae bacterium]|nr:GntR family transcriptional regulator [Peptococcaceae bacterium]MDH7523897.1 GntR family transcriptional regulator [Peptococcaceae bacterium]